MTTANEELRDRGIRRAVAMTRLGSGEAKRIEKFLRTKLYPDLIARLRSHLDRIRTRGHSAAFRKTKRYREMLAKVDGLIAGFMAQAHNATAEQLDEVAKAEARWQQQRIREAISIDVGVSAPSPAILRGIVRSQPFNGRHLRDWWRTVDQGTRRKVRDSINVGLAQGESTDDIVRRVRGTRANRFRDGALATTTRNARAVVRTAVTHTTARARELTYQDNADVIKSVQWLATLDDRTTIICASLDGKVFPIGEGPRPPAHVNCRSTTIPVVRPISELGAGLGDLPEGTRASLDGQVAASVTFPQWLKTQPKAVQVEVLGARRAALFAKGLPIERMVDRYNQPLTLAQIEARERQQSPPRTTRPAQPTTRPASEIRKDFVDSWIKRERSPEMRAARKKVDDAQRAAFLATADYTDGMRAEIPGETAREERVRLIALEKAKNRAIEELAKAEAAVPTSASEFERVASVSDPADLRVRSVGSTRVESLNLHDVVAPASKWYGKVLSRRRFPDAVEVTAHAVDGRAFARPKSREIHLDTRRARGGGVAVHEIAHILEIDAGVARSMQFLIGRTSSVTDDGRRIRDPLRKLSELPITLDNGKKVRRDYPSHEVAWPDKFDHPYMGKDYKGRYTELLAVGLETLYRNPIRLARNDPEMFDWLVDFLQGND